ncbi:hypothetical protein LTR95_004696 [Oleoguttula sp. CCFEE 5521]
MDSGRSITSDENTRASLKKIAAEKPRYLFRAWDRCSGGDARLNTTSAITPSALLDTDASPSFDNIPLAQLAASAQMHLQGCQSGPQGRFKSYFSSWSHSLHTVIHSFAWPYMNRGHWKDLHLSMIDTDKIGADVMFLYVPAMEVLSSHYSGLATWHYSHEFLAFRVVSGEALQSGSFRNWWNKMYSGVLCLQTQTPSDVVAQALDFGASGLVGAEAEYVKGDVIARPFQG